MNDLANRLRSYLYKDRLFECSELTDSELLGFWSRLMVIPESSENKMLDALINPKHTGGIN